MRNDAALKQPFDHIRNLGICASMAAGSFFLLSASHAQAYRFLGSHLQRSTLACEFCNTRFRLPLVRCGIALGIANFKNGMDHLYRAKAPLWVVGFVWVAYTGLAAALFGLAMHLDREV